MPQIEDSSTLFQIDEELANLMEAIESEAETNGEPSAELIAQFQSFCTAHECKVDRIGRFLRMMEARDQFCRSEAARLGERARAAAGKVERTKNMVLYYLLSRDLKKIEGQEFTLRAQKNSQDSVHITNADALPLAYQIIDAQVNGTLWGETLEALPECIRERLKASLKRITPNVEAIRRAREKVPGAEVKRGEHLRVA